MVVQKSDLKSEFKYPNLLKGRKTVFLFIYKLGLKLGKVWLTWTSHFMAKVFRAIGKTML